MVMHVDVTTNAKLLENFLNASSQFLYHLITDQEQTTSGPAPSCGLSSE